MQSRSKKAWSTSSDKVSAMRSDGETTAPGQRSWSRRCRRRELFAFDSESPENTG